MASNQTIVETNTTVVKYKYEWKINNFLKYYDVLRGPEFSPLKSVPLKFVVELEPHIRRDDGYYDYNFNIIKLSKEEIPKSCRVEFVINIKNGYSSTIVTVNTINKSITVFDWNSINLINAQLKDKTLHVKDQKIVIYDCYTFTFDCTFTFFGFDETTVSNADPILQTPLEKYSNICSGFKALYESKAKCDVIFEIGTDTLKAHQCVLMAQSPVFKTMLESDLAESKSKCIQIADFDAHEFDCFLKYLYCGDADFKNLDIIPHLFALADKYEVSSLMKDCSAILATSLTIETVFQVIIDAYLHSSESLKEKCIKFIHDNFSLVKNKPEWEKMEKDYPELTYEILKSLLTQMSVK